MTETREKSPFFGSLSCPVALLVMAFFAIVMQGCSMPEKGSPLPPFYEEGWSVSVIEKNSSALIIRASSMQAKKFTIGDDFSNARRYLEVIDGEGEWNVSPSSVSGMARSITYIVHFPIGWSKSSPYGTLSDDFGVVPATFLFPRSGDKQMTYRLDFSNIGMKAHNSGFGDGKTYVLSEENLFETYFVFGKVEKDCEFSEGNVTFSVVFGGGKQANETVCSSIGALLSYYTNEFGQPEKALQTYEIGFFPARAYSSLRSGFYYPEADYEFMAHELFHLWEPADMCRGSKLMEEMFASYFQVEAQYKAGIINRERRDALLEQKRMQLSALPREYLSLSDEELIELRKKNASAYSTLVYSRGALIGGMMENEGFYPADVFRHQVKTKDCVSLSSLIEEYDEKIAASGAIGVEDGQS